MTSARSPACNVEPRSTRSVRSVVSETTTSPRTPCGLSTRPTSSGPPSTVASVDDVDGDVRAFARACGAHDGADGLRDASAPADDLAHVVRGDVQAQRVAVGLDVHRVGR